MVIEKQIIVWMLIWHRVGIECNWVQVKKFWYIEMCATQILLFCWVTNQNLIQIKPVIFWLPFFLENSICLLMMRKMKNTVSIKCHLIVTTDFEHNEFNLDFIYEESFAPTGIRIINFISKQIIRNQDLNCKTWNTYLSKFAFIKEIKRNSCSKLYYYSKKYFFPIDMCCV